MKTESPRFQAISRLQTCSQQHLRLLVLTMMTRATLFMHAAVCNYRHLDTLLLQWTQEGV